jgi:hypothetical protein
MNSLAGKAKTVGDIVNGDPYIGEVVRETEE